MKIPAVIHQLPSQPAIKAADDALDQFLENDQIWNDFCDSVKVKVRPSGELSIAQRLRSEFISLADQSIATIAGGEKSDVVPVLEVATAPSSAKYNEESATDALKMVRIALYTREYGSFKSDNKTTAFDLLMGSHVVSDGTFAEMNHFAGITDYRHISALRSRNIWGSTKINCLGLAVAAMDYVRSRYPDIQVSLLNLANHHAVSVLGIIEEKTGRLPLREWAAHLYVCDPWANIVCPAPEYPDKFVAKMEKWESVDKVIRNSSEEWISPTDSKWLACVEVIQIIFSRKNYSDGQFNDFVPLRLPGRD